MGEGRKRADIAAQEALGALGVEALGGAVQVRWSQGGAASPFGQMVYFAEFLNLTGLYRRWQDSCPLRLASPNGSNIGDILGTLFLSVLSGHRRYAHIAALRADGVSPSLLGMEAIVAEDTVRRALGAMEEETSVAWMQAHLDASVLPLLAAPWILDSDVTVKPLYGKQEGAVVGYNPKKPGRPSHAYHTYQMAGLRLMLSVVVAPGNASHADTTLPGLIELLDQLPAQKRPALVRGDAGQGGEPTMKALEERAQHYLFKLRLTKNVKRYIERIFATPHWLDAGQGSQFQLRYESERLVLTLNCISKPIGPVELVVKGVRGGKVAVSCDFPTASAPVRWRFFASELSTNPQAGFGVDFPAASFKRPCRIVG